MELSALDDRLLGLPLRLQIEERLPAPLLALELESILFFTAVRPPASPGFFVLSPSSSGRCAPESASVFSSYLEPSAQD